MIFGSEEDVGLSASTIRHFRGLILGYQEHFLASSDSLLVSNQFKSELQSLCADIENLSNSLSWSKNSGGQEYGKAGTSNLKTGYTKPGVGLQDLDLQKGYETTPRKNKFLQKESQSQEDARQGQQEASPVSLDLKDERMQGQLKDLQRQKRALVDRLSESEKKVHGLSQEKKYCVQLLNRNASRDSDLEIQNKVLRNESQHLAALVKSLEAQNKLLKVASEEKSTLLQDIDQFFKADSFTNRGTQNIGCQRSTEQNNRLIKQIQDCQQEISGMTLELDWLRRLQESTSLQSEELSRQNDGLLEQFYRLSEENGCLRQKNQEVINIQEGKKLNDIVHKENKHLLQVNYELGNRIYSFQKEREKLTERIDQLQRLIDLAIEVPLQEYGISTNPSASRGICYDDNRVPDTTGQVRNSRAEDIICQLSQKLQDQAELNSRLQRQIEEHLSQLYVCQKSIFQKEKEIANLNNSLKSSSHSDITARVEIGRHFNSTRADKDPNGCQDLLSLEEFVQKFEPSLMDTLFIMLRITQIAVVMLEEGFARTILPIQILLQLDEPHKPQNIIVQLKSSDRDQVQTQLFDAPQVISGSQFGESAVVWNIAMLFYYLVCKKPYFKEWQIWVDLGDVKLEHTSMPEIQTLIESSLLRNPERRIGLDEILEGISHKINKIFSDD